MDIPQFRKLINRVAARAAERGYPEAQKLRHIVGVCRYIEEDRDESAEENDGIPRTYAHCFCRKNIVCWSRYAPKDLSPGNVMGIAAHELGHILRSPDGIHAELEGQDEEVEADVFASEKLGWEIGYDERSIQMVKGE